MIKRISVATSICLIGLLLSECKTSSKSAGAATAVKTESKSAPAPTPAPAAETKKVNPEDITVAIAQGKEVYEAKCHQCHAQPVVSNYPKDEWPNLMNSMAKKAHLTDIEKMQAMAFVLSGGK